MIFELNVSPLADTIYKQVTKQGFCINAEDARELQKLLKSVNILYAHRVLTKVEMENAMKRIFNKTKKAIEREESK